jgi:uncharacterized protein with WD repeat
VYDESFFEEKKMGIWVFDVTKELPPEHIGAGKNAVWNPSGDTLAILDSNDFKSWTIRLYDLKLKEMTAQPVLSIRGYRYRDSFFAWSSDGKEIIVDIGTHSVETSSYTSMIHAYNLETEKTSKNLYGNLGDIQRFNMSPSQRVISFWIEKGNTNTNIFMTMDNGCRWEFPKKYVYPYAWSPDSQKFAYEDSGSIYIANLKENFGENFENTTDCPK